MIYRSTVDEKDPECPGETLVFSEFVIQVLAYAGAVAAVCLFFIMGNSPMLDYPVADGEASPIVPVLMIIMGLVQHFSMNLQVAHVCHKKFSPLDLKLLFYTLASVFIVYLCQANNKDFGQKDLATAAWLIYTVFLICQLQFIIVTVN